MSHPHTTPDLYFAAFLQCSGGRLIRTFRSGPRCYFAFELQRPAEELRTAWYARTGQVSALEYANAVQSLKAMAISTVE